MRARALWTGAMIAVLLAGCSGGSEAGADGKASAPGGEAAVAGTDLPRPEAGLYRATITMTGIEVPGMGAAMQGHGGGMTTTSEYCLTAKDVEQGFAEMMKRGQDESCRYEKFSLEEGRVNAVMLCQTASGEARMEMKGTATPTGSEFEAKMKMDLDGMGNGTMRFAAKHERIGDCP